MYNLVVGSINGNTATRWFESDCRLHLFGVKKDDGVGQPDLAAEDDVGREQDVAVPGAAVRELAAILVRGPLTYDVHAT